MTFSHHKLEDLCEIVSSKRVFAASYQSDGIPFFRGKEVSQLARGEKTSAELYISEEVYSDVVNRTGPVAPGDILLTAVGTLGNPYQVKKSDLPFYFKDGNIVWLRKFSDRVDPLFLFYWLNSEYGRSKVLNTAIGSTQAALTISGLSKIEIDLPGKRQQGGLVSLLTTLDSKIAGNHALSKTLEDIAQTIFKSWFIDFDPVKAKMAGEKPVGMDTATAALFPDSMEDSEFGLMPKGWEVSPLGEVVDLTWGDTKTTKASYVSSGYLAYSAKGQDGFLSTYKYDQIGIVLSAIGAGCGKTWLATGKWSCIKNTIRLLEKAEYLGAVPYVYLVTVNPDFWPKRGSAQPFIGQEDSRCIKIVVPCKNLLGVFSQFATPIYEQVSQLHLENVALESIRNQILPRLISGELQIPEEMLAS